MQVKLLIISVMPSKSIYLDYHIFPWIIALIPFKGLLSRYCMFDVLITHNALFCQGGSNKLC